MMESCRVAELFGQSPSFATTIFSHSNFVAQVIHPRQCHHGNYPPSSPQVIAEAGTEEQKRRYLSRLASGEVRASLALTENCGNDLQSLEAVARPHQLNMGKAEGGYVIRGKKRFVVGAEEANLFLVFAKSEVRLSHFTHVADNVFARTVGRLFAEQAV